MRPAGCWHDVICSCSAGLRADIGRDGVGHQLVDDVADQLPTAWAGVVVEHLQVHEGVEGCCLEDPLAPHELPAYEAGGLLAGEAEPTADEPAVDERAAVQPHVLIGEGFGDVLEHL